ncbi:MAG: M48 family metallopeptidase [Candidatus Poribacteria bacterium]|nr:M48 family metallopeptidase [Candidatus Poribacteria bacterium]
MQYDEGEQFNAYATTIDGANVIKVTKGAMKYTHSESELAFIVAHEFGHHIGDHLQESMGLTVGEGIGLLIGLSIISDDYYELDAASDIVSATTELGGMFDRPSFSRAQESEADLFATKLVINAGYDVNEATQVLVNMASISSAEGFFSTHPSGPVRLATAKRHVGSAALARIEIQEPRSPEELRSAQVAFQTTPISNEVVGDRATAVKTLLQDYQHLDDFYVSDLPARKVAGFLDKANLPENTEILGYMDTTVWGSGKNGVIFTPEGVHYTNDFTSGAGGSHFVSYSDIIERARPTYKSSYFYIGDERLPERGLIDLIGGDTDIEEFSSLFRKLVEWGF